MLKRPIEQFNAYCIPQFDPRPAERHTCLKGKARHPFRGDSDQKSCSFRSVAVRDGYGRVRPPELCCASHERGKSQGHGIKTRYSMDRRLAKLSAQLYHDREVVGRRGDDVRFEVSTFLTRPPDLGSERRFPPHHNVYAL